MPEPDIKSKKKEPVTDKGRRDFLFLLPLGIFAGLTATIMTAAFRFLRPAKATQDAVWSDVAPLSELKGEVPIMRSITTEHQAAWTTALEEHFVYVLPHKGNEVLSNICPHEGCDVAWRAETNQFVCPCHDSYFASDGSRLSGPCRRGLDPLEKREQDGKLQVKFQTYVNNTEERIPR